MLEGLDKIDWGQYKARVDVPQLLRELASDNEDSWWNACGQLADRVLMSRLLLGTGPVEYASEVLGTDLLSVIAPFLVELLRYPDVRSKRGILDLLDSMVSYREVLDLEEPLLSRANQIPKAICPDVDTLLALLPIVEDRDSQCSMIRLLKICATEECEPDKRNEVFKVLIGHTSNTLPSFTLWYLIHAIADGLEKVEISTDLKAEYLEKLAMIQRTSDDDEVLELTAKLLSANCP